MENQNDIRGLLSEKFEHHEASPTRDIWAQIEADIRPQQKTKVIWWPYAAVAASALILFGLWALLDNNANLEAPSNGMTEMSPPSENAQPANPETSLPEPGVEENFAAQQEEESEVRPQDNIRPLFQRTSQSEIAQQPKEEIVPRAEETPEVAQEEVRSAAIALNPISPINPQLYPDAPVHNLEDPNVEQAQVEQAIASKQAQEAQLKKVKDNKLNLNEFSLENVVAFASNELSKIAGSPLDYEHQAGQDAERKRYEFELGDFKITRTSFRKTIKP
ncbi:MAG: hypothetical protein AAFQ68_16095 [Bacteroidota bacterium]